MKAQTRKAHTRTFFCTSCHPNGGPGMTFDEMKKHLLEKHPAAPRKGNRSPSMVLDGDFYQNTYEWTLGDVRIVEIASGPS